jgi:hypothetical protein
MPSRLRQSRCRSSNPSLSGRVGVKRFQTTPSIVSDVHSQGPRFSSGSALGPPVMESGGCGGPICQRVLAVRLTAGIGIRNGLASSIVPAGGHRSAISGIRVFSCWFPIVHYRTRSPSNHPCCQGCAALSNTPGHVAAASSLVQRNSVPSTHTMHDDRQPSRHSDDRALHATMPGNLDPPGLEPRPLAAVGH